MYHPVQLTSFSLMHLEYFLEDLSDEDARERLTKRDGTRMNAIPAGWRAAAGSLVCHWQERCRHVRPHALAQFSFTQLERFINGDSTYAGGNIHPLSDNDARKRLLKGDGSEMNAASWLIGHMSWQWARLATRAVYARDLPHLDRQFGQLPESDDEPLADLRRRVYRYRTGTEIPPDPPSLDEVRELLREAREATAWLATADDALLASTVNARDAAPTIAREPIGKNVMRAVLHTFTHGGELLAIRQMLGHPEIAFMDMAKLSWPGESELNGDSD